MKPSSLSLLVMLGVTQLVSIVSAVESDTTPDEAYYSSLLQQSSQQQYDDGIERSDRKSDYSQQALQPATSYSAIVVHNTPDRLVKASDYMDKGYRTADSGIGDYQKSREEGVMSRNSEYANHMSSSSDALMQGVHPDIMQTLLNQQPQTFDNSGLVNTGYSDFVENDNRWMGKSAEQESDYNSDKNDKYSRKRQRKNRNYKKTYNSNNDESKNHQGNFGDRDKPLALPSSRVQIQNARPDSIFNVGYSIGIHGPDPSVNSDGQLTKGGSNVHYEGRNTVWKELGSGVEMSVNKRKPKNYIRSDDKESRRIVDPGEASGSIPSSMFYYNDATPDNSNVNTYNANNNGFDHNHALRHSNSFDFSNAINPKTGLPYSMSADEIINHFVPKTDLSPPAPVNQENSVNREVHESRINKQIQSIDKEDSRTPRILTTGVNKYSGSSSGNTGQAIPSYSTAQKFSTNYNLIQSPFKSAGTIMYPVPLVLPKTTPLTSVPYIPPQGDFTFQNLATLPNTLKTPPPPLPGAKSSSSVMALLVPVNGGHMILPPLINTQFDLPYYGFYGNVIPPYAPNRFVPGLHSLPPALKPEFNLQNHQRNHPLTVMENQDFLLTKSPLVRLDPSGLHSPNRKPVDVNQDSAKHHDLVRYTRGNNNQRQRPLQPLHYTDELNLFPYVFNEKNKFTNFRPGNLEAQESGPFVFVSTPQQRLPGPPPPPSAINVNHNPREVLSPPPLYNQSPSLIARS